MKKAIIVSNMENRFLAVKEFYEQKGYKTIVITSDYIHGSGYIQENEKKAQYTYIHALQYKKNLSIKRIWSYIKWSKDVFKFIKSEKPDIVYINIPANSLLKDAAKYKRKMSCDIVVDILDLWPESLPFSRKLKTVLSPILNVWRGYRNKNLKHCHSVFTECSYYQDIMKNEKIDVAKFKTLHLFGECARGDIDYVHSDELRFLYLGSINNIIDISKIVSFLQKLNTSRRVVLKIIGDGEKRDEFIAMARTAGISTYYYGKIYDDYEKQVIINESDFGLNIYKQNICVGLTTKSIDYFRGGLPIINTIAGDTYYLVDEEKIGFNLSNGNLCTDEILELNSDELVKLRERTLAVYNKYFTIKTFHQVLDDEFTEHNAALDKKVGT